MVENGLYGYKLHVPGYKDINVEFESRQTPDKRLIIVNGAQSAGNVFFKQNSDYSVTLFAGTQPGGTTSNFELLKKYWRGFSWPTPGGGSSGAGWDKIPTDAIIDEDAESITIPADSDPLQGLYYSMAPGETTTDQLEITLENYIPVVALNADNRTSREIKIKNRYQLPPNDFKSYILGTKVLMKTSNKDFLEKVEKIQFTRVIPDPSHPSGGTFMLKRGFPGFSEVTESKTESGVWELELKLNLNQIKHLMPDASQEYRVQVHSTYYQPSQNPFSERFTAMEFVTNVNDLKNESNPSETELADLDKDALTQNQFDHVSFAGGVDTEKPENVDISGTIAGAITNDDMDSILDAGESIKIETTISDGIEAADKKDIMDYLNGHHLGEVKHAVGIRVVKTYPGQEAQVLHEIGVNSALVFSDMPELEPGKEYIIVTKHNGKIKTIPVTYKNGQVIGYTKEFSSFVLTTQDAPAPSKKESSSGSSSTPKKDNVVTCQMAGYPASYAWNESAKACQPGYLDNNGVFHLTTGNTNKRVGVVNTSDKGIGGMLAGLISSTIIAIAAAYALKKWN